MFHILIRWPWGRNCAEPELALKQNGVPSGKPLICWLLGQDLNLSPSGHAADFGYYSTLLINSLRRLQI